MCHPKVCGCITVKFFFSKFKVVAELERDDKYAAELGGWQPLSDQDATMRKEDGNGGCDGMGWHWEGREGGSERDFRGV